MLSKRRHHNGMSEGVGFQEYRLRGFIIMVLLNETNYNSSVEGRIP